MTSSKRVPSAAGIAVLVWIPVPRRTRNVVNTPPGLSTVVVASSIASRNGAGRATQGSPLMIRSACATP